MLNIGVLFCVGLVLNVRDFISCRFGVEYWGFYVGLVLNVGGFISCLVGVEFWGFIFCIGLVLNVGVLFDVRLVLNVGSRDRGGGIGFVLFLLGCVC